MTVEPQYLHNIVQNTVAFDIQSYTHNTSRLPSHLFVSLQHQSEGGYLLSLGTKKRFELQNLLHAAFFVLVQQRGQFPGCSSLSGQLQRPVNCPLEVLHLRDERRSGVEEIVRTRQYKVEREEKRGEKGRKGERKVSMV